MLQNNDCPCDNACGVRGDLESNTDAFEKMIRRALVLLVHKKRGVQSAAKVMRELRGTSGLESLHSVWNRYAEYGFDTLEGVLDTTHQRLISWEDVCRSWSQTPLGEHDVELDRARDEIIAYVRKHVDGKHPNNPTYELFSRACKLNHCADLKEIVPVDGDKNISDF